jgi:hypothetical protein
MHNLLLRAAPEISAATHTNILEHMQSAGHFGGNGGAIRAAANGERTPLSPMRASRDEQVQPSLLRQLQRTLARAGYDLDLNSDQPVKLYEIDRALKASAEFADPQSRMAIKSQLALAKLID